MDSKSIEELYGIQSERQFQLGSYNGLIHKDKFYILAPLKESQEHLLELKEMANHLVQAGDRYVLHLIQTKDGKLLSEMDGKSFCLLSGRFNEKQNHLQLGRKLAKFHLRGLTIPFKVERTSRIGQWKQLWEKRLDQMESVWRGKVNQVPENDFERLFIESFPYYMGLTENAIQYLVDTELDENPAQMDNGTVCHERFSKNSWGKDFVLKNPMDWVFDHRSRDLAEWTREEYFDSKHVYHQSIRNFYKEYQTIAPLSAFAWRLLYARLLFPLHYFECIENYYITRSEQEKKWLEDRLAKHLQTTGEYERFLGEFYQLADAPIRKMKIPLVEWIPV